MSIHLTPREESLHVLYSASYVSHSLLEPRGLALLVGALSRLRYGSSSSHVLAGQYDG